VLELCTGGALDARLEAARKPGAAPLLWKTRLQIAIDVGTALAHLHSLDPPLLHRDVKSANVLLDEADNAKVADFGTVHIGASASTDRTHVSTRNIAGTRGYM
jgi:serine/threonine protein kinase